MTRYRIIYAWSTESTSVYSFGIIASLKILLLHFSQVWLMNLTEFSRNILVALHTKFLSVNYIKISIQFIMAKHTTGVIVWLLFYYYWVLSWTIVICFMCCVNVVNWFKTDVNFDIFFENLDFSYSICGVGWDNPLHTLATSGPSVPSLDDSWWNENWQEKPKYSAEPAPVSFCPTQTSHNLTCDWTWAASSGKLTTNCLSYGTTIYVAKE